MAKKKAHRTKLATRTRRALRTPEAARTRDRARPAVAVAEIGAPTVPMVPVIQVPAGGTAVVIVDVGEMTVPYTVAYAGKTIIKSVVDRAAPLPLLPGDQVLGWAFAHMVKGWHHTIGVSVNGGDPVILESLSEANKDQDHSVNFAIVRA